MDTQDLGNRIRKARMAKNYSINELANELGVAASTIHRYESGTITSPRLPVIQAIADALNVNPAWLVGKDVPMKAPAQAGRMILNDDEKKLVLDYRILQDESKNRLNRFMHYLKLMHEAEQAVARRCEKLQTGLADMDDELDAAHALPGATPEQRAADDAIMDDDEFWNS